MNPPDLLAIKPQYYGGIKAKKIRGRQPIVALKERKTPDIEDQIKALPKLDDWLKENKII
jgi:hypothetical protein